MNGCEGEYMGHQCDGAGIQPHVTNGTRRWYCEDCLRHIIVDEKGKAALAQAKERAKKEMYDKQYGSSEDVA